MKIPEYNSLEEKAKAFSENQKRIDSVCDLLNVIAEYKGRKSGFVFRGICEAKYKNFSSLQRKFLTGDFTTMGINIQSLLQKQINSLRRKNGGLLSKYYKSLGIEMNDLLYLSIAQHYGGISPLLDFSEDYKTALYFMANEAKISPCGDDDIGNYMSLYVLQYKKHTIQDFISKVQNEIIRSLEEISNKNNGKEIELPDTKKLVYEIFKIDNFSNQKTPIFIPNKPQKIKISSPNIKKSLECNFSVSNLNIVAQDGCFVYYFNQKKPNEPLEDGLICYDIHKSLAPYIMNEITNKIESKVYPDEYAMVSDSCRRALTNIFK